MFHSKGEGECLLSSSSPSVGGWSFASIVCLRTSLVGYLKQITGTCLRVLVGWGEESCLVAELLEYPNEREKAG